MKNVDEATVEGFGDEWSRFDQSDLSLDEQRGIFESYFAIFPWSELPAGAVGFDAGCGSGRWASLVAPRVGKLHCIDASDRALAVARRNLSALQNVELHHSSVSEMPMPDGTMDFGYSLGVLHHLPDTSAAIKACAAKLKKGAPLLLYLYYAFDNRPPWFARLWRASDAVRRGVSRMPHPVRYAMSQAIALGVYLPLARTALGLEKMGAPVESFPLSAYRHRSFYVMRTDALDRFGTRLEQRFTRREIRSMMEAAGLERVAFSDATPHWCAVGYRA
jgi:ubiquinone/menaquinone biosynthesis C-methylase UbiE